MNIIKILFSFDGRIRRSTWWLAKVCINGALYVASLILVGMFGENDPHPSAVSILLSCALLLCTGWMSLAVNVKRWHDRGKSGLWEFINLVPGIGPLWALGELGFGKGTKEVPHSILGRQCVHCRRQIVSYVEADSCRACQEPLHHDCATTHLGNAHVRA